MKEDYEGMSRVEYEALIVIAAKAIHLIGCWQTITAPDDGCPHHIGLWSGEAMEANAAFGILFDHLGLTVPDEIQGTSGGWRGYSAHNLASAGMAGPETMVPRAHTSACVLPDHHGFCYDGVAE